MSKGAVSNSAIFELFSDSSRWRVLQTHRWLSFLRVCVATVWTPASRASQHRMRMHPALPRQRTSRRGAWARRILEAKLCTAMTKDEIFGEATSVYDNYVEALETGTFEALQAYARNLSERIIPRGVETDEVVGIVLLLRD